MASPAPSKRTIDDLKANLVLTPALTSNFEVYIKFPDGDFSTFVKQQGIAYNAAIDGARMTLICSEASLPGSQFSTHEVNNDFHGTTERFAYRRLYDDRIDLTFYVDAENYLSIRMFETWMKYIAQESISDKGKRAVGSKDSNYYYRFRYPDGNNGYRTGSALSVTKFERNMSRRLRYDFIKPYPISITSMPISYDVSSLLKCTVSMTYIRYIMDPDSGGDTTDSKGLDPEGSPISTDYDVWKPLTPEQQAAMNKAFTSKNLDLGVNYGQFTTTGGVNPFTAKASGNTIDTKTAYTSDLRLF